MVLTGLARGKASRRHEAFDWVGRQHPQVPDRGERDRAEAGVVRELERRVRGVTTKAAHQRVRTVEPDQEAAARVGVHVDPRPRHRHLVSRRIRGQ